MNNYNFPENIRVHPSSKKLISSILNLDPSKRPSLDAILEHEFFRIYNSVPVVLPLSTLACPPSNKYISQFTKNEGNFFVNNNSGGLGTSNTYNNAQYKYLNNLDGNNQLIQMELNKLNNMNSAENINYNENSKDIINRLLNNNGVSENGLGHRKSESLGGNNYDENFMEKVNQILQNVNNNNGNGTDRSAGGSRNIGKGENFVNSKKGTIEREENQNIINNNYFINVGNLNNMELKLDNSVLKKLEEGGIQGIPNLNVNQLNLLNNVFVPTQTAKNIFMNKITKFYDYTNKFGIIYFVNNSYLGICFNDYSNILKNCSIEETPDNKNVNKELQYIYLEKDGKNILNFDENGFEAYIKNIKTSSKDIVKKFDIFKHILQKYTGELKTITGNFPPSHMPNTKICYVKKFLKVQQAMMFRLSNKLIQVSFVDKTELIMSTETSDFLYRTKNNEEMQDSIQNVMGGDNLELIKRIKFAKNLLIHFVKNQKSKKVPK